MTRNISQYGKKGTGPGTVGPDAYTIPEREDPHALKQTNKKVQNCASKIICKNKYSFRISKQIRCFWSLQV